MVTMVKNMERYILDRESFLLLESKEDKTKRMLRSRFHIDDPYKVINAVKHDFSQLEHSDRPAYKFLYAICRMYCEHEFADASDIATMNNMLKIISVEPHLSEYNHDLNGLSKEEIFRRFTPIQQKEQKEEELKVRRMKFDEPSDYEIVKIDSYNDAKKYARFTSWCVTHDNSHFESYNSNGMNQFYFCLRKGFEDERKVKGAPLNSYGLSMISVCVDYNGMPLYITTRYNHEFNGENNENLCTPEQVSQVIKMNFFETFLPSEKGRKFNINIIKQALNDGKDINQIFDSVEKIIDNFYKVKIEDKTNYILNNKLMFDNWDNDIQITECLGERNGKLIVNCNNVKFKDKNIKEFPFIFNKVSGIFNCGGCLSLTSLEGAPEKVGGDFGCYKCDSLTSLKGAPREVGGDFNCNSCGSLTSLEGAPEKVGEEFSCNSCGSLTSLEGVPREVGGSFYCCGCDSLTSLEGAPEKVGYNFYCYECVSLTSLEGAPETVWHFYCYKCDSLTSLKGAPEKVDYNFDCSKCRSLTSLEGAPREVGGYFDCSKCKLTSLEGAPEKVDGTFCCNECGSLTSLKGAPREVGRDFDCSKCRSLTSLEGAPERIGGDFHCSDCRSLTSLEGAPEIIGWNFYCRNCRSLTSLEGAPKCGRIIK